MKFLYNPDLRLHTIHALDVSRALLASAEWMIAIGGRTKANELAGENIPSAWSWPSGGKMNEVEKKKEREGLVGVPGVVDPGVLVKVPLFNVVRLLEEKTLLFLVGLFRRKGQWETDKRRHCIMEISIRSTNQILLKKLWRKRSQTFSE